MRRILALAVLVALGAAGCWGQAPLPEAPPAGAMVPRTAEQLYESTLAYYQAQSLLVSWWEVLALGLTQPELRQARWQLPELPEPEVGAPPTAYASAILSRLAVGESPHPGAGGRVLTQELAGLQREDGGFGGSLNQTLWAVIALEVAHVDYRRQAAREYVIGQQLADGGFSLGGPGDADITGMALVALALLYGDEGQALPLERARGWLARSQLPEGGFASYGQDNANSLAVVIWGLVAAGTELRLAPWDESQLVAALARFQLPDGSFTYLAADDEVDALSTAQALLALADLSRGESSWVRLARQGEEYRWVLRDQFPPELPAPVTGGGVVNSPAPPGEARPPDASPEGPRVHVRVVGTHGELFAGVVELSAGAAHALAALAATGLDYVTQANDAYVRQIGEERENLLTGAGWKYRVNGTIPPVAAIKYQLEDDDELLWWYASHPGCTGPD